VIKFSGVNATATTGNSSGQIGASPNDAETTVQASSFTLQIEDVKLTLSNGNGNTVNVQSPAAVAPAVVTAESAPKLKAAAAGA
jgi:hypothetical protein